ncbi:MAG: hypothetical protein QM800_11085 [Paludibacter sp.]
MKNTFNFSGFLMLVSALLIMNSCVKQGDKQNENQSSSDVFHLTDTLVRPYENPKITEFKAFVEQLDSSDMTSAVKAADKYKEIFSAQPALLCDSGFVVFQALYDSLEQNLSTKHQNDTTNYEPLLYNEQASVPQNLKDYRKNLQQNGFKISASEGVTYIEQDRSFIARNFYALVTPAMKSYLSELQKENKEGFAIDGAISISPRQLVDRTVWYEKFMSENPDFVFKENCKNYQKAYLTYLVSGYQNTSLYADEAAKELSDFYVNAYNYLASKFSDTQLAQMVAPYYEALKLKQTDKALALHKDFVIKGKIYNLK